MCCRSNSFSLYNFSSTSTSLISGAVFSFSRGWHTNFNYALLFELLLSKQLSRFYKSLSCALWLLNCYKSAPDGACRLIIKRKITSSDLG